MSALSVVLTDFFRTSPDNQQTFATKHGLDRGTLNRVINGKVPGESFATSLIAALPIEYKGKAAAAWVQDSIPAEILALLLLMPASGKVAESSPLEQLPDDLTPKIRKNALWYARMASIHPEIQEIVDAVRRGFELRG